MESVQMLSASEAHTSYSLGIVQRVGVFARTRTRVKIFVVLFNLALLAWLVFKPVRGAVFVAVDDAATVLGPAIAACWCFAAWRRAAMRQTALLFIGLGILGYAVGDAIWAYYEVFLHQPGPFPSWADAAYLCTYPLLLTGILMIPRQRISAAVRSRVVMDGILVMAALATFSWYFVLGPTILDGSESLLGKVLGAFYPIGDLILLFCLLVLGIHAHGRCDGRMVALMACGIVCVVIADTALGYLTLHDIYETGCPADIGWSLGYMLIGLAASGMRDRSEYEPYLMNASEETAGDITSHTWRSLAPYMLVPAAGVLLLYSRLVQGDERLERGVYVGCTALILFLLARQVLTILENGRLHSNLQAAYAELAEQNRRLAAMASTDSMTGLPNHGTFQKRLHAEVERVSHSGAPSGLLLLDVDDFKALNDTYGHLGGDGVLKRVADLIWEVTGDRGYVARYGGDEFVVLLPEAGREQTHATAETIRAEVSCYAFPDSPVTVSVGVTWTRPEAGPSELIAEADLALYAAKNAGRNRVVTWDELNSASGLVVSDRPARAANESVAAVVANACPNAFAAPGGDRRFLQSVLAGPEAQILLGVLSALDLRDRESEGHSQRVARFAMRMAQELVRMRLAHLSEHDLYALAIGALLHDIGKIGIPDNILLKNGPLTEEEWEVVHQHPDRGAALLKRFPGLSDALPVVRHHHERWDGRGYPDALKGRAIPLAARIFAFADTLDAMSSDRPYRKALPYEAVRQEVARMAGTQFDPHLVAAFMSIPAEDWQSLREASAYLPDLGYDGLAAPVAA